MLPIVSFIPQMFYFGGFYPQIDDLALFLLQVLAIENSRLRIAEFNCAREITQEWLLSLWRRAAG